MNIEAKTGLSVRSQLTTLECELFKLKRDLFFISHFTHEKLDPDKDRSNEEYPSFLFTREEVQALWSLMMEAEDRAKALFAFVDGWIDEESI